MYSFSVAVLHVQCDVCTNNGSTVVYAETQQCYCYCSKCNCLVLVERTAATASSMCPNSNVHADMHECMFAVLALCATHQ
jgi:hypothetical protein